MGQKQINITREGLIKLEKELEQLVALRRPEVAEKIKRAREVGGTENNAEYDDAKNEQAFIEGRILQLENTIKNATVIEAPVKPGIVELGNIILIQNQDGKIEQYTLVGSAEADPLNGRISDESPVGRALLNRKTGEEVEVTTPAGVYKLSILEIR
jgi:transcription elongation factor GreA